MKASRFLIVFRVAGVALGAFTVAYFSQKLGNTVPIHWNFRGEVDGYGSKWMALGLFPALILTMMAVFSFLPNIDPKGEKYEQFSHTWELLQMLILGFMAYAYVLTLSIPFFPGANMGTFMVFGLGTLFVLMGNYFGKIRSNYFLGIRTPWTLADEDNWNKTHRFGGRVFVVAGLAVLISAATPPQWSFAVLLVAVLCAVVLPFGYSYRIFQKKRK
jgi:uncharacterized membrane protein